MARLSALVCLLTLLVAGPWARAGVHPLLVITDTAAPSTLDPFMQHDGVSRRISQQIFETLVTSDGPDRVRPLLASKVTRLGERRWRITLRRGVRFHNGEPFDARAAAFSLRRLAASGHPQAPPLSSIKVLGPYSLELSSPSPALLSQLAYNGYMLPPRYTARHGQAKRPVGTGPYRFVSADEKSVVLAMNPDYWGGSGGFLVRKLIINHSSNIETRRRWLLSGKSQVMVGLNPHLKLEILKAGAPVRLFSEPSSRQFFLVINPSPRRPANQVALADPAFRRALNQAVDVGRIIQVVLLGNGIPTHSCLNDRILGWSAVRPLGYDPKAARRVIRRVAPQGLTLTLAVPEGRYVMALPVARAAARYLEQTGLRVTVKPVPWPQFLKRILQKRAGDWDLYYLGWSNAILDAGYTLSPDFCSSPLDRTCPPWLPAQLVCANDAGGPQRQMLFRKLNRDVASLAPWVYLHQQVDNYATAPWLTLRPNPQASLRVFYDISAEGG